MADNTEQQFREANVAIDRAVAAFFIKIELMSGKWDDVAGDYIIEGVILRLCDEIAKLIDHPDFAKHNIKSGNDEAVQCAGRLPGCALGRALADQGKAAAQDAAR